jgi:hypothetical protein
MLYSLITIVVAIASVIFMNKKYNNGEECNNDEENAQMN